MKIFLFFLFITAGFSAVAQRSSYSKNVTNDGQRLRIRVDIRDADQSIHYNRSFDVSHLNRTDIQALERRVLDSLEAVALQPVTQKLPDKESVDNVTRNHESGGIVSNNTATAMASNSRIPYEETVEENTTEGRLKVRFTFKADGQDNSVERSATIRDNTEGGRRKLREEIKRQLTREMEGVVGLAGV